ncbi:translation initiation factor IF-2 [Candidatus Magnetominusculus dajiuhuensis]|uniref:translation initiation factor IF-2 n=1 Tax=Candidatus Magnetominusculus dajiuhuensis TaxID=3137712 RepID=UPI003B42F209
MHTIRINEVAKELDVPNKVLLDLITKMGIEGKTHSSGISQELADRLKAAVKGTGTIEPVKPRTPYTPPPSSSVPPARPHTPSQARPPYTPSSQPSQARPPYTPSSARPTPPRQDAQPARQGPHNDKNEKRFTPAAKQQASGQKKPTPGPQRHSTPKPAHLAQPAHSDKDKEKLIPIPGVVVAKTEEEDEITIPDRFKKKVEVEKAEKAKPKVSMQRAFQSIRKVEQKKIFDSRSNKKGMRSRSSSRSMPQKQLIPATVPRKKVMKIQEGTTVSEFAKAIGQKISEVIKKFMELGTMPTINQPIDIEAASIVAETFGVKIEVSEVEDFDAAEVQEDSEGLVHRPPVVTIMGHVDHGKTSLLDAIRKTKVTESEAGGITQHIGAYKVTLKGKEIVFLDTPGHEAFTTMRARGAKVTDIVVLVVAADDGVMPQTIEAIDHARAAAVPIVAAVNKIDKPNADIDRVKKELAEHEVISEAWGGKNIFVEVSAKKKIGIEDLLEMIILQAEMMELKANPKKPARGVIIESRLDKGRGAIATVLIQSGTLKVGDVFVAGVNFGRVRALIDDVGVKTIAATPSTPVEVIGFSDVPNAGEMFMVVDDEKKARQITLSRKQKAQSLTVAHAKKLNLDELYARIKELEIKELNIIIKADVQGSAEALRSSLEGIKHEEVKVKVIHTSMGGINESDVMLASASNAIIIGFNVRADAKSMKLADREGVDIRFYNVIYDAINEVKKALEGLLEPTLKETILGTAEVRQLFTISRIGTICGCQVTEGVIQRGSDGIRVIRDNIVIYEGKIATLRRFKDDIKEAHKGYDCGILVENFNDVKVGDILENFKIEKVAGKL